MTSPLQSKPRKLALALAAIGATATWHAAHAVVISEPLPKREAVTEVIVNGDVVIESETRVGSNAPQSQVEKFAFAGEPGNKREVRIVTSGGTSNVDISTTGGVHDIDALVSKAMAEAFAGGAVSMGRNVKNAPYSAEIATEKIQTLADGNQITKRTSSLSYRDSAGRTRQEVRDSSGNVKSIHIHDVVDGARTTLLPATRTATKTTLDRDFSKRIAELKEKAKSMVKDGRATIIERSNPNEEIVIYRSEGGGEGRKEIREDVQVRVVSASEGGKHINLPRIDVLKTGDLPPLGDLVRLSPLGSTLGDGKWSSKSTTTSLGVRDFEGVRAEGKSTSYSIPAGEIGNKNAIVVSTETWYSPELQATVYSKHSDPRNGETVYRMTNIKRSEPSASLFTVPDGYKVTEAPGFSYKFRTERAPDRH
jgi:hypothetical protein